MNNVDKGVKIPANGKGGKPKYPFGEMEIGDSVFFNDEPMGTMSNPVLAARAYAKYHGTKVTARKEGTGVRVWRTA